MGEHVCMAMYVAIALLLWWFARHNHQGVQEGPRPGHTAGVWDTCWS